MKWTSPEGRALLWRAWPAGYLAAPGVHTVQGWRCAAVYRDDPGKREPTSSRWYEPPRWPRATVRLDHVGGSSDAVAAAALAAGDLLPNPDPADTATWACLCKHLADTQGVPNRPDEPNLAFHWHKVAAEDLLPGEPPAWCLWVASQHGWTDRRAHDIDVDDPAHALVLALIQAKEGARV